MTTKELVARVTAGTAYQQNQVATILRKTLDTIKRELANGGQVQLIGFGTFEVKERNARKGINPRTGDVITIPEHKTPTFRAGKSLKEAIRK